MKCPFCGFEETKVVDTRPTDEGFVIRRRRECNHCQKRFTTYEKIEDTPLLVIKKDGSREVFNSEKIMKGLLKSCEKRTVPVRDLEELVNDVERELRNTMEKEVSSQQIGEMVMERLKEIDEVAYVRFASVYRHFKDINTFMEELKKLLDDNKQQ
ncbi:MAG: transcriptional repressor NrdR [Thermosediminibacterales bacterium]|nr:transcriptional repressor NrdR [Thermosediminibacterales bacterium]MDK2836779.1 transcriptional repressor NrdR [Thermosediminibacterales bacterium]